jgi:hypothetical protein
LSMVPPLTASSLPLPNLPQPSLPLATPV